MKVFDLKKSFVPPSMVRIPGPGDLEMPTVLQRSLERTTKLTPKGESTKPEVRALASRLCLS